MDAITELPANRNRLNDSVFRELGEEIVLGGLAPGESLQDRLIADRLGVSRTPVREALLRLERLGLVVIHASRRTFVSAWTPESLRDGRRWAGYLTMIALREAQPRLTASHREACAMLALDIAGSLAETQRAATLQFALLQELAERTGSDILREEVREREFAFRRTLAQVDDATSVWATFHDLAAAFRADDRGLAVSSVEQIYGLAVPAVV